MLGKYSFCDAEIPPLNRWDVGPEKTPYACSFHWFRLLDGRIAGLDVIRTNDTGQLSLRAYVVERDGEIRALNFIAPLSDWLPFASEERPPLDADKPCLGRGPDWIAGSVRASGQAIESARFSLDIAPEAPAASTAALWKLQCVYLSATDYPRVRTTGWLEINGTRFEIDSHGPVSLHFGAHLPAYGYCATVPDPARPGAPNLLLASVCGDDIRVLGEVLKNEAFTYAYGDHGVPSSMVCMGPFEENAIPIGLGGSIELSDIRPFHHEMVHMEAITASAQAVLKRPLHAPLPLGQVILDYRGRLYTSKLVPPGLA
jgi:hypothetical protein